MLLKDYFDETVGIPMYCMKFYGGGQDIGMTMTQQDATYIVKGVVQSLHALMRFQVLQEEDGRQDDIDDQIIEIFAHHNIALFQAYKAVKTFAEIELGKNHSTQNVTPYKQSNVVLGSPVSATDNITGNDHVIQATANEFIAKAERTLDLIYSEIYMLLKKF